MTVLGLVGRIAAGKSTVARLLADQGATLVDADAMAHAVLAEPDVAASIARRFGPEYLDAAGRVWRDRLAAAVFGPQPRHAEALAALEAIVHPRVRQRIAETLRRADDREVLVLDVPLLLQGGWGRACDFLIEVHCDDAIRRQRMAERGWNDEQAVWRDTAWQRRVPEGGAAAAAPAAKILSVDAGGGIAYTREQVERLWKTHVAPRS
jgi:dephospho-CoA kinase